MTISREQRFKNKLNKNIFNQNNGHRDMQEALDRQEYPNKKPPTGRQARAAYQEGLEQGSIDYDEHGNMHKSSGYKNLAHKQRSKQS